MVYSMPNMGINYDIHCMYIIIYTAHAVYVANCKRYKAARAFCRILHAN